MLLALILASTPSPAAEPQPPRADATAESHATLPFKITPFGRLFFRPDLGLNPHDHDFGATDTDFIFALRTNTGTNVALGSDIHVVVDLQSYGTYNRRAPPREPGITLYPGYLDFGTSAAPRSTSA